MITLPNGLSLEDRERAMDAGPEHTAAGPGYPALLESAGFAGVTMTDATDQYCATLKAWIAAWDDESEQIRPLVGAEEFADRQARRKRALADARDGLLSRQLISAR